MQTLTLRLNKYLQIVVIIKRELITRIKPRVKGFIMNVNVQMVKQECINTKNKIFLCCTLQLL